jgi:hypothetical protein
MSLSAEQTQAAKDILCEILSRASPEELMLVDDSIGRRGEDDRMDGMLGFGIGPEYQMLLPVILVALKEIASSTAADLIKAWGVDLAKLITHGHRDSIDPAAIKQLRSVFLTRLEKQGFGPQQATQAADCVVATMTSRWDLVGKLRGN